MLFRSDSDRKMPYDLRDGMESTLMLLKHRLKATEDRPEIEVVKAYDCDHEVECFPSQINQVFMNLLANAIDALEEDNQGRSLEEIKAQPNQIFVSTELSADQQAAVIRIGDNGIGMPAEIQSQIFDHFTTKPVNKGTGLGLSISHQIVVKNHQGTIEVHSTPRQGTKFEIRLPLVVEVENPLN